MSEAKIVLSAEDRTRAAFASLRSNMEQAQASAGGFQAALVGALALGPVAAFTANMSTAIGELDRLDETAPKVGLTTQALAEMGYAAKMGGASTETLESAIGRLSEKMSEVAGGNKEAARGFDALGVKVTDANGKLKAGDQIIGELADRFAEFNDGPAKTALAMELFGKSGKDLIPLLNGGSSGLKELRDEFNALTGGPIEEAARQAAAFNDSLDRLHTKSQGFYMHAAGEVLPLLNQLATAYVNVGGAAETSGEGMSTAQMAGASLRTVLEALVVFGSDVAYVFKQTGNEIGGMAAQIASLFSFDRKTGDWSQFFAIGAAMKEDAAKARQALDDYQNKVLSAANIEKIEREAARLDKAFNLGGGDGKKDAPVLKKPDSGQESEYDTLIARIKDRLALADEEISKGRALTDQEKFALSIASEMDKAKGKLNATERQALQQLLQTSEKRSLALDISRSEIKAAKELSEARQKARNEDYAAVEKYLADEREAYNKRMEALKEGNQKLAEEAAVVGLSKEQIAQHEAALISDTIAEKEAEVTRLEANNIGKERAEQLKTEIALLKTRRELTLDKSARETAADAAATVRKEWEDAAKSINQSLTDALLRGFESGKDFASNFRDTLVNMFKTLVLRPVIQAALSPVAGAMSNFLGGGGFGTGGGMLSTGASMFGGGAGAIGGGMSLANSMGSMYANMTGGGLDALLATNGAYGTAGTASGGFMSGASSALPVVGWIAAGMALSGSLYDKGYKWDSANTLADPGMTINTKALGALGIGGKTAAILTGSSILAAALDKLGIGGEERAGGAYTATSSGVRLNMGPSGGEIAGSDVRTAIATTMAETDAMLAAFGSSARVQQLQAGLETSRQGKGFVFAGGTLTSGAGFGVDLNGDYFNQHRGDLSAKDALTQFSAQLEIAKLQALKAASDLPKVFADQLASVDVSSMTSEARQSLLATFTSITADVTNFRAVVQALPFDYLRDKSFDAAEGLIQAAGGLDKFTSNLASYYATYYTQEEQRANSAKNIAATLTAAGLSTTMDQIEHTTKQQFRQWVEAYGAMGDAGQGVYAALLSVNQAFAQVAETSGEVEVSLAAVATARQTLMQQYEQEQQTLQDVVNKLRDFATGTRSFRDSLLLSSDLSTLTPDEKYAEAWREFNDIKARADARDTAAQQQLQSAAQAVLQSSRDFYGSSAQYSVDFASVQAALTDTATRAAASADVAQLQLDAVTSLLDPLKSIDHGVTTVAQALANYQSAVMQAMAAGLGVSAADQAAAAAGSTYYAVNGSHAAGLDRVPFDGYIAELHQDETVLNRRASSALRAFVGDGDGGGAGAIVKALQAIESRLVQLEETVAAGDAMNAHATQRNGEQVSSALTTRDSLHQHAAKAAKGAALV